MDLQDRLAAGEIGRRRRALAVEAAGTQQGRVEILEPVRGAHHDNALGAVEAVELDQQLIQRLILLAVEAVPVRALPIASSSSMKMIEGAFFAASWKSLRMRAAPRPANISTNDEALCE